MPPKWEKPPNRGRGKTRPAVGGVKHFTPDPALKKVLGYVEAHSGISQQKLKEILDEEKQKANSQAVSSSSGNKISYAQAALASEDDKQTYVCKNEEELILYLQKSDKQWSNDPWYLLNRYLEENFFPFPEGKTREFYENILVTTGSCEITAFPQGSAKNVPRTFSKIYIRKILTPEEWGMSPFRTREFIISKYENISYNYYDYIDAFSRVLYYENSKKTHSWWIKFNPEILKVNRYPEWIKNWWNLVGPPIDMFKEPYKGLYTEWLQNTPLIHGSEYVEGSASLFFFMQAGIPWIWKWAPNIGTNKQGLLCLNRKFYCKFWNKLTQQDPENPSRRFGWEIELIIQEVIKTDRLNAESIKAKESQVNIFDQISRKIKFRNPNMSQDDLMEEYLKEVKKDFITNFKPNLDHSAWSDPSDKSMKDAGNTEDEFSPLPGESQPYANTEDLFDELINTLKAKAKGKGPAESSPSPTNFH